jgi:anti-sigma regulatory factor (Ser/Thr protein kinase)
MTRVDGDTLLQMRIPAQPERLRLVRSAVSKVAGDCGCSDVCIHDIMIAVDEACQNIIRHAYRGNPEEEIVLEMRRVGDRLIFDILDFASPVDEKSVKPRPLDEIRPGGLGTHFIRECMDEADFRPPPDGVGNLLRMVKRIS